MSDSQRKKFPACSSATKGQAKLAAGPAERLSTVTPKSQAPYSILGFVQEGRFEGHKYCPTSGECTEEWKVHLAEGEWLLERGAAAGASSLRPLPRCFLEPGLGNLQSCCAAVKETACPAPCSEAFKRLGLFSPNMSVFSQNRPERFGLGGTSKLSPFQPRAVSRDISH